MPTVGDLFNPTKAPPSYITSDQTIRVLDGDTFELRLDNGGVQRFRLLGVDTPETAKLYSPAKIGGDEATKALYDFLERGVQEGTLQILPNGEEGRHGRSLATVRVGDQDFGSWAIDNGQAAAAYDPTYRSHMDLTPNLPSEGERAASQNAFQEAYDIEGQMELVNPGPGVRYRGSTFEKGVSRGVDQLKAGFHALTGQDEDVRGDLARLRANPRAINSVKDIDNLGDFQTWFAQLVGEEAPGLAVDAAMFVGGLGVGSLLSAGARKTATRATLAGLIEQSAGEVAVDLSQDEQIDLGKRLVYSLGAGTAMGALDYLSMGRVVDDASRALGLKNPLRFSESVQALTSRPTFQSRLADIVRTSGTEAGTEFVQEAISTVAKTAARTGELPSFEDWDNFIRNDGLEALAAGAALGGAVSGVSHGASGGTQYLWSKLAQQRTFSEAQQTVDRETAQLADSVLQPRNAPSTQDVSDQNRRIQLEQELDGGSSVGVVDKTYATTAEPRIDLEAQFGEFQAGTREAFFVSSEQEGLIRDYQNRLDNRDVKTIRHPEGVLFTRSPYIAQVYEKQTDPELRDSMRADLLGYAQAKADIGAMESAVVATETADGARVKEQLVNQEDVDGVVAQEQADATSDQVVKVETPVETQTRRALLTQAESGEYIPEAGAIPGDTPIDLLTSASDAATIGQLFGRIRGVEDDRTSGVVPGTDVGGAVAGGLLAGDGPAETIGGEPGPAGVNPDGGSVSTDQGGAGPGLSLRAGENPDGLQGDVGTDGRQLESSGAESGRMGQPSVRGSETNAKPIIAHGDEGIVEDIVTRTLGEMDQSSTEVQKFYRTPFTDKGTAQAVIMQLRRQFPSVRFSVTGDEQSGFRIDQARKSFATEADARGEANRLNVRLQETLGVLYAPTRVEDQWVLEGYSVPSDLTDSAVARQFLPRAIGLGYLARSRNNRNQYIQMAGPDGHTVPVHTKTLTAWGRRGDDSDQGSTASTKANKRWFDLGLANMYLFGYRPVSSEVDQRGNLKYNKDIAASDRSDISQNRGTRKQPPLDLDNETEIDKARRQVDARKAFNEAREQAAYSEADRAFIADLQELRSADPHGEFHNVMVSDDAAFALFEDRLSESQREQVLAERNLLIENNGMLGIDPLSETEDRSTGFTTRATAQHRFYGNIRRGLMREATRIKRDMNKVSSSDRRVLMNQLVEVTNHLSQVDAQMAELARVQKFSPDTFNRKEKRKDTWVDLGRPYPGSVPFWFMQQDSKAKSGKHAVVYGGDASVALSAFESMAGDLPNVVVTFGDSLPDAPAYQVLKDRVNDIEGKGQVIYDAGSDFALVYVNPSLGKVEQQAVLAHEIAHIYVEFALGKIRRSDPQGYQKVMAWAKRRAGEQNPHEWLTNQMALKALGEHRSLEGADPAVRRIAQWIRRFWGKIKAALGDTDVEAEQMLAFWKDKGLLAGVTTGYMSPFANEGYAKFTQTVGAWGGARLNKLWDSMRAGTKTLAAGTAPVWQTADGRLRAMGVNGRAMADMFWVPPGQPGRGRRSNLITQRVNDARTWDTILNSLEKRLGDRFQGALNEYFNAAEGTEYVQLSEQAKEVYKFFHRFYTDYLKPRMPTLGRIEGVFAPTVYDPEKLRDDPDGFTRIMRAYGYTPAQIDGIRQSILNLDGFHDPELEALLSENLISGVVEAWSSRNRKITNRNLLAELRQAGYLIVDNVLATRHYLWQMTKRAAMENVMGGYANITLTRGYTEDSLNTLTKLFEQTPNRVLSGQLDRLNALPVRERYRDMLRLARETGYLKVEQNNFSWYRPTHRLRQLLLDMKAEDPTKARDAYQISQAYLGRVGLDMSPDMRKVQSRIATYQAYTTLAFSAVASLPDLMGPILRMRRIEYMIPAMRDAFRAMVDYKQTDVKAREFGFGSERMDHIQILEMYGLQFQDALSQKWSNRLFKYNGQEYFTHLTRSVSLEVGQKAMLRAAHDALHGTTKEQAAARDFLSQLGLLPEQIRTWQADGLPSATDLYERRVVGRAADNAAEIHAALHRFVDESIVRPNAAVRPVWASNPKYMLLWQLKSFFYAYGKIIVKPFLDATFKRIQAGEIAAGLAPYLVAVPGLMLFSFLGMQLRDGIQKIASFSLMTPLALVSDEWREEQGRIWGNSYFDNMSAGEYTWEVFRRTGAFGPWEMLMTAGENRPIESRVGGLLGPAPQQGLELLTLGYNLAGDVVTSPFTDGEIETQVSHDVLRAIPGLNQLPSFKGAVYNAF